MGLAYLQHLYGLAVLLLPAQLGDLDQDRPRVTRVLTLKTGRQFPALVGLLETNEEDETK